MKYAMIVKEIEKRIADGYLEPGSKLPSIRALSEEFS